MAEDLPSPLWHLCISFVAQDALRWLEDACGRGDLNEAKRVWSFGLTVEITFRSEKSNTFRLTCKGGHLRTARWLWSLGLTLDDLDPFENASLIQACRGGHTNTVRWLWSLGLTLDELLLYCYDDDINFFGTPFQLVCSRGHFRLARWLWGRGLTLVADNMRDNCYRAFACACESGNLSLVQWLWGRGLTIEGVRSSECQILRWACHYGHLPVMQWLWGRGVTLADLQSANALGIARSRGHPKLAQWLQSLGLS